MFSGLTSTFRFAGLTLICMMFFKVGLALDPEAGIRQFEEGNYDSAVVLFQQALREAPGNYSLRYNLALSWFENGNTKDALPEMEVYLERNPIDAAARMNFGLMLFSLSQYQKASDQFSRLLNDSIWSGRAFCYNGLCSYALGEYELALQHLEACHGDSSFVKQLHGIKGDVALVLERWDEAADYYDKAILEDPDYPAYYLNRGIAQFWLKKYEKAHSDFTVSLALQPDQKKANLYRAYCEEAMGYDHAALQDFKQAGVNRPDIEKRLGRSEFLAKYWYFIVIVFLLSVLLIVVVLHRGR